MQHSFKYLAAQVRIFIIYTFLGLLLSGSLVSCKVQEEVKPEQEASQQWLLDRLYFGRSMPEGEEVSEANWEAFVAGEVTPRFPDGFTQWNARGQWQDEHGVIIREPTFIVEVAHSKGKTADEKLEAIIEAYKKRFQQQSVLRITHPVTVRF